MSSVRIDELPYLDVFSEEYTQDPYPLIARARAEGPVARSDRGLEFLTHTAGQELLGDLRCNTGFGGVLAQQGITDGPLYEQWVQGLLGAEGELHKRLRLAVMPYFSAGAAKRLRDAAHQHVDEWVAEAEHSGEFDFADIAGRRLPSALFCHMIGVPVSDAPIMADISERMLAILTFQPGTGEIAEQARIDAHDYLRPLVEQRKRQPGDDLISALVSATGEGALSDAEVMDTVSTVLGGSTDNTNTQLCLNLLALAENPGGWRALKADRALVRTAVLEGVRWKPGFLAGFRVPEEEFEYAGITLEPGQLILLNTYAANRDPAVYTDPDRFDVGRKAPAALNFGHGRHFCVGRAIALVEMEETLNVLLDRWSEFSVGDVEMWGSPFSLRVQKAPVRFDVAAPALG
ncbi:cytochrome P450 [Geodermatophilus sp. URMC 62]|uniref:cytochrome P450 n=1 Tax=Geodermatophilus sp. URMC 62 TaxID=3423414 RepID=UPI00406D404C